MKKVLLVVALLLLATPVYAADVTITTTAGDLNTAEPNALRAVRVGYTATAADTIRAFALVLTVDSGCNLDYIRDFNKGECNVAGRGYGIFPGKFRDVINAAAPDWGNTAYNPIAPAGDLNGSGGNDNPRMVVELGTIYQDTNYPGASGTLFTVDVNFEGKSECNLCVAVEQTRGGVVKSDATAADVTLPACLKVTGPASGCTVPTLVGLSRTAARAAILAAGFTNIVENNVPGTGQAVRTVIAQGDTAGSVVPCDTVIDFNAVSHPIKDTAPTALFANWVTNGRPACWAYPRQCRGDGNGTKQGLYWVGSYDLAILKTALNKAATAIPLGGICADATHTKQGLYWVGSYDLAILKTYLNKAESLVATCGTPGASDPNYWYFCLPTGVACPTGKVCATAGICPNTP
jgi:hypothetical protein